MAPSDPPTTSDKRPLTGQQIHDEGLEGWSKVLDRLTARFATGDFGTGAALVTDIAAAADEADHHPDVDLRYPHVTVALKSHDVGAITARDVRLARRISELAGARGIATEPHAPDVLELALDTPDLEAVRPFWAAVTGYEEGEDDVTDAATRLPSIWFQATDSSAPDRQRWHLDVSVPREVVEERIEAAVAAGGRLVSDAAAPAFWVLADSDGNQVCLCTWESRD
jgi:4a-hydroxytetrahydrobiopterin dehydratase